MRDEIRAQADTNPGEPDGGPKYKEGR